MNYSYLGVKTTEINYIEINRNKIFSKNLFSGFFQQVAGYLLCDSKSDSFM